VAKLLDKKVLIIGALGQDGLILSQKLIAKGAQVFGIIKDNNLDRPLRSKVMYTVADFSNKNTAFEFLNHLKPDFIFHLAARHSDSRHMNQIEFEFASDIYDSTVGICLNLLDWQKNSPRAKIFFALSSFMYAENPSTQQISIDSDYSPKGLYGQHKVEMHQMIMDYRMKYNSQAVGMILFNHTSIYSKSNFLLPTLARTLKNLLELHTSTAEIHEANTLVDISDANDFCDGFIRIMIHDEVEDFIFSSGKFITIQQIVEEVLETKYRKLVGKINFIPFDGEPKKSICGDITKTVSKLGWRPTSSITPTLIRMIG